MQGLSYEPAYRNLLLSCKVGTKGSKCHIIPSILHVPKHTRVKCLQGAQVHEPLKHQVAHGEAIPRGATTLAADFHKHFVCFWTRRLQQCCLLPRSEAPVSSVTAASICPLKQPADLSNLAVFGERVWQVVSLSLTTKYSRKLSGVLKTQVESQGNPSSSEIKSDATTRNGTFRWMVPSGNVVWIPNAFGSQRMASGQLSSVQRQKRCLDQGLTTLQH